MKQATEEQRQKDDVLSRQSGAGGDGGGACPLGIRRSTTFSSRHPETSVCCANYKALNKIMDEYIPKMRGKIIEGMHSEQFLSRAHRTLAEGFAEGNIEKAREGLKLHFHYIYQYL
ncbi:MAG: hypothetical protein ACLUAR_17385 [Pilosibacter sp.]